MSPLGMNARELEDHLERIPEDCLDREVVVMLRPDGEPEDGLAIPGVITMFEQFPATISDPQPSPAVFHIYATEGMSTAAEVEVLRTFQSFLDSGN